MLTYAVIGTGAIGGYYGGRLAESGKDVQFLARSDTEHLKTNGLKVLSPLGDFHLKNVSVFQSTQDMRPVDVIIVSLKTISNRVLQNLLPPLISPKTNILLMQNGLGMEEEVQSWFPGTPVIGGMCFICSQKREPGVITHMDYGAVTIGTASEKGKKALSSLAADLDSAQIPVTIADNLGEARWRKLLWNIPYNGLSVILNADTKEIMNNPSSRSIIRRLMEEVVRGARACGHTIVDEEIEKMLNHTDNMTPYEPSMKLDYDNHRSMELEYMYRKPLAVAEKQGCPLPYITMMCRQLEFLDARNLNG